jgi:outer membrane protein TolC
MLNDVLQSIEANNKTLQVLRSKAEAQKMANRTGLNPGNPEVEYIYQWGKTSETGNKSELSITQEFDFPTAYRHRSKLSQALNEKVEREYLMEYYRVMSSARELCLQFIHQNALQLEYEKRWKHAEDITKAYHLKYQEGAINVIERNKADLNLLAARNALMQVEVDQQTVAEHLAGLNGGQTIQMELAVWPNDALPADFDAWFNQQLDKIPQLGSLTQSLKASQQEEQLNRALSLPKLAGGYSSETGLDEQFRGVNVGISIPL